MHLISLMFGVENWLSYEIVKYVTCKKFIISLLNELVINAFKIS